MPKTTILAVVAIAAGCATRPNFDSVISRTPVESPDVADDHETIEPGARTVLVSDSGDGNPGVRLPTWSAHDADSLSSDELSVPPSKSPFRLLRLLDEKNPPFRQW
jgi:hypothetical protein